MLHVEPRFHTARTPARRTRGPEVSQLADLMGRPRLPWQRRALDVALELDDDGRYWFHTVVVTVQRQTGKTDTDLMVGLHRALTVRQGRVWHTMQNGKLAGEWMRDTAQPIVAGSPLKAHARPTRRAGAEGWTFPATGSTFSVFPPTRDALHSKQSDLVNVDEAWVHDHESGAALRQAIRPTMQTRPGSQLWVSSTLGDDRSVYLDDYVELGRAAVLDPDSRVCIIDYGIPDDVDPEDIDTVARYHPGVGYLCSVDTLRDARADFASDAAGYARAYGNRASRTHVALWPAELWTAAGQGIQPRPQTIGLGVDVTPANDRAAVAVAWRDATGRAVVELARAGMGTGWAAPLLAEISKRWRVGVAYDSASAPTLGVVDRLARLAPSVAVSGQGTTAMAAACATADADLRAGLLVHAGQPALDDAVSCAARRPVLDGSWLIGRRKSGGSVAELNACIIALRAYDTRPASVSRPRIVTAAPRESVG